MYIQPIRAVFASHITSPTDRLVALALAAHVNMTTGEAWPSIGTLQSLTGLSDRAVQISLRRLVETRQISAKEGRGRGHSSVYSFHPLDAEGAPIPYRWTAETAEKGEAPSPFSPPKGEPASPISLKGEPPSPIEPTKGESPSPIPAAKGEPASPFSLESPLKGEPPSLKGERPSPKHIIEHKNKTKAMPIPSLEEMTAFAAELKLPASDAEYLFWKWTDSDWKNGNRPIKDWKATVRSWKAAGYLPSQKAGFNPRQVPDNSRTQKKEGRAPEVLDALLAIVREHYPDARPARYEELPLEIRTMAEKQLARQGPPLILK